MAPPRGVKPVLDKFPSKYTFLKYIGAGAYGRVIKCLDEETGETVAIKLTQDEDEETRQELSILKKIKSLNLDKHNIVKYIDCFQTSSGNAYVFESLDISLYDYWERTDFAPMLLSDIRTIIQQMATALKALKENQLIHTDIKMDNIMMVNHRLRPFEVKLIDFGLAINRSDARRGMTLQPRTVRSPEIILGGKFSEAIDMWTLGCAMFEMINGCLPFSGDIEHEVMLNIVELLGQPDASFLAGCQRTRTFFKSLGCRRWRIKTPAEYSKICKIRAKKRHNFKSLDELKAMRLEENNLTEAVEREQCIELLKAMLTVHPRKRITPGEVLTHPFITKGNPNVQTDGLKTSTHLSEDFECEPLAAPMKDSSITIQPDGCTASPKILPSGMILVRPATAENTTLLEDQEGAVSELPAAPLKDEDSGAIQPDGCAPPPEILPSDVILVRPVITEITTSLEDQESALSELPAAPLKDEDSICIQPDNGTPSPEILPSGMILVRPATAENTTLLEDQESAVSEPPTAPQKVEDGSVIKPDGCSPSREILLSGVILARPVTNEDTTLLEDREIPVGFQSVLKRTSESSVSDAGNNTKISEDSTTCEDTVTKKKGKKKKNCFRRVLSWLRKKFSCQVSPID